MVSKGFQNNSRKHLQADLFVFILNENCFMKIHEKKLYFNNFITFISEKLLFWAKVIVANSVFQRWLQ